jgi:pimeloyl-ACP methyl ester carboxylesterase
VDAGARSPPGRGELLKLSTRSWGEEGRPLAVLVHGVTGSSGTWWRVGPWFAENGWHAVAVDLRGHGSSPRMSGGEGIDELAGDLYETISGELNPGAAIDVLLGHSLGALAALKLCEARGDPAKRLVLEDPPGSEITDFEEIAAGVETDTARAREAPDALEREQLDENPSWEGEDSAQSVAGMRECDAGPVAELIRTGLRYNLAQLVGSVDILTFLVLGSEERGSASPEPERTAVANALRRGKIRAFDAGHGIHRDDFGGYVRLLNDWLGGPR